MTSDECPCPRHFSWATLTGAILTGATLGWATATLTITQLIGAT